MLMNMIKFDKLRLSLPPLGSKFGSVPAKKEPGTPAAKYCLLGGREMKRVLKSLESWSLKNTINFGVSVFSPFDMYLGSNFYGFYYVLYWDESIRSSRQPKSATHIRFRDPERVLMSKWLATALIFSLATSTTPLCTAQVVIIVFKIHHN